MTFEVDLAYVEAVLLADGWHHVSPRTFALDFYRFVTVTDEQAIEGTFDVVYPDAVEPGVHGFTFVEQDSITGDLRSVAGPMTSLLALRYGSRPEEREYEGPMTTY